MIIEPFLYALSGIISIFSVVGDGNNDIEMFEVVGNTVAMGNASDELKEIATDVCKTAADDGIYHYCVEKGLIS